MSTSQSEFGPSRDAVALIERSPRWKRYVHPDRFRIYFFDDLKRNPLNLAFHPPFLGADPNKPTAG
jgi:hypothetical protein